ncbi:MAG: NUDIX domain-containing protein [Planctomycetota bacterium]|nr:MAG: NUDIX domain-containing protein [Planctomycetota bacterium]
MSGRDADGYRRTPVPGPTLRTDIVEVYVFRAARAGVELLQVRRARPPMAGGWHPLMGHIEPGESAVGCATREILEEVGLGRSDSEWLGFWQLEGVHPYYLAAADSVVLSPCFAVRASPGWAPRLNEEHDGHRWVSAEGIEEAFMWPGQRAAAAEVAQVIAPGGAAADRLGLG